MPAVTLGCVADARFNTGGARADDNYLDVGYYQGVVWRSAVKFAMPDWAALHAVSVDKVIFQPTNGDQAHVARGSSPQVVCRRATEVWYEASVVYTPANTTVAQAVSDPLFVANNVKVNIDITSLFKTWVPVSLGGGGNPNYGFLVEAIDESINSRTTEFWSRESGKGPVLIVTYTSNLAPNAPSPVSPVTNEDGTAAVATLKNGAFTITGTRVDPDAGDYITNVEVAVYSDATTDATAASATKLAGTTYAQTGSPTSFSVNVAATGLSVGTAYRYRVRTADKNGAWGAWTPLASGRIIPDTPPSPPSNTAVDVASLTPNFYGSLVDADTGATLSAVRVLVYQDTTSGAIQKWDSDWQTVGGTRFTIAYGGSQLDYGTTYRWAAQVKDEFGAASDLAATKYSSWVPVSTTGPDNMTPRNVETKQNSVTPTLTVAHSQNFTNHRLEVALVPGPTQQSDYLWQPALGTAYASTTSKAVTYAGLPLTWGRTFYWRAMVFVGGTTWTDWSPWYPFYINALPRAPVVSVANSVASGVGQYGSYRTTPTTTPTITVPFSDPDIDKGYSDVPTRREIEITRADTLAHVTGSPFVITSSITSTYTPAGGVLSNDVTYRIRARYDDSANQRSAWSAYLLVKPSQPPTVALTSPASGGSTSDPTPTLDWAFTSPGGKAQKHFRVRVYRER